jgi:signal transduction histidine kinase
MLAVTSLIHLSGRMLAQQAKRTEAAEEARDRAIGDERARIARELHDVVSHHVTAMTLQAEAAIVTGDRAALQAVSTSGREALAELRRMLGVLRYSKEADVPGPAALTPQPDLSRLEHLADRAATSLQVDIVRTGEVVPLAAGVELCAYRIVQEAVTNVGKHSDATRAVVTLAYGPTHLAVEVRDDGRPLSTGRFEGSGHGLVGMTERVALISSLRPSCSKPTARPTRTRWVSTGGSCAGCVPGTAATRRERPAMPTSPCSTDQRTP